MDIAEILNEGSETKRTPKGVQLLIERMGLPKNRHVRKKRDRGDWTAAEDAMIRAGIFVRGRTGIYVS